MGDNGSLNSDIRRKSNKYSKVNRIVSLFEIPRPNKQRGLQRTNSLPASRRSTYSLGEQEEQITQPKSLFGGIYNQKGKVKRIKEELEEKSKKQQINKTSTVDGKKSRSKRSNCDLERIMDDGLEEKMKKMMQNLVNITNRVGKIKTVSDDIEHSDTELEITFDHVADQHDNIFQNTVNCQDETILGEKEVDEDSNTECSRLSSDTIVNRLSSDNFDTVVEKSENPVKVCYTKYDVGSTLISYSRSTSSESEQDDRLSQENDSEVGDTHHSDNKSENNSDTENGAAKDPTHFWINNLYKHNKSIVENNQDISIHNKTEDIELIEDVNNSEIDSITWWKHKSFVQLNNNPFPRENDTNDNIGEGSKSSENTLEKRRRFIKNQVSRQSPRSNRRRTGILMKSKTVKDLAKCFEGFKDAAENGETEYYRQSFIDEMDKELENMKNDGFKDDFHLSLENLTVLDHDDDDHNVSQYWVSKEQKSYDEDIVIHLSDESIPQFETKLSLSNPQEEKNYFENITTLIDDDPFGETLFSEDLEHGLYYVESYNADGKELIMCSVQVDRQSVDLNKLDEVKSKSQSNLLAQQDDERTLILMGAAETGSSRLSSNDSNNGTESKRTTIYSTTSGDSFDDRMTDDEGIYIESSSSSYGYSAARRETYCDDQGIIRIERVAPYQNKVEENPEYMEATNYYYSIDDAAKDEAEENYYDSIRLEHEITVRVPEVKKETLQYIVEEIKVTERKYVEDMKRVLYQYKPFLEENCPDHVSVIIGNMENIYLKQIEFLETLDYSNDEIKEVVEAFIDFEDLFRLYPRYFKNTPKANVAVKELADVIKEKQEQLNDKLHLSAYLLTPLQRLGKYKLFLENITKQLKKEDKSTGSVQMALDIIKKYMSRGNDAVAIASILHSPLHLKDYGSFVTREKFTLIKPKRMELMVFLFQEVIIFTTEDQTMRNMEQFIYWQSIRTDDLRIATFDDTTIHLTDYTKTKRRFTSKYTFILDAKTQKLKNHWKQEIEEILWMQLKKVKENTLKEYQSGKKMPKKLGKNRVNSTGSSVFYVD